MWTVYTEYISDWFLSLDLGTQKQVLAALEILAENGPHLGRPLVDSVVASQHSNMKELRPGSTGRSEIRILFAFDPERQAVLLIAGDKSGNWKKWYRKNIPLADKIFDKHLEEQTRSRND